MLTPPELYQLLRELADTRVLSVYLDTRATDPAMRNAWRPTLLAGLRAARARIADDGERDTFDRAAALLDDPFPAPGGLWGAPGWVAFVTAEGRRYVRCAALESQRTSKRLIQPSSVNSETWA